MSNIKIVCDSLTDLPKELMTKYDIDVVPLSILINDVEYTDGVDLTKEEFYALMRNSDTLPKTSQATYVKFKEAFDKNISEGKTVLYIGGSSVASGTFQSAKLAIADIEEKIYAFDTLNLSIGAGQYVLKAAKMIEENKNIDEILSSLETYKNDVKVLFSVDTLEYLQKGGRVSMAQASIGNLLNIKPILQVASGTVESCAKARGKKQVASKIIGLIKESFGENLEGKSIILGYGDNVEEFEGFKNTIVKEFNLDSVMSVNVGSCICSHSGPSLLGISCL